MTDLRKAAQQALVALECMIDDLMYKDHKRVIDISNVAITALRTALKQSEPPPEWEGINNIISEYGLQAISFVAEWKAAQRQWVGLTDEHWEQIHDRKGTALDTFAQGAVWAADRLKGSNT